MKKQNVKPWPSRFPLGAIVSIVSALIVVFAVGCLQIRSTWTPLQRYYLPDVFVHELAVILQLPSSQHRLVIVSVPDGKAYYGRSSDFAIGETEGADGRIFPFTLSDDARNNGVVGITLTKSLPYKTAWIARLFRDQIYPGMSAKDFATMPLALGLVVLLVGFLISQPLDQERTRVRRFGRRLRGPEYLSASAFIRRLHGDGVGVLTANHSLFRWLSGSRFVMLRIPRKLEASGIVIIGAVGSGKSAIFFQLIKQIIERGERLVVIDPALELTERFFNPLTDIILNPGDARSKAWDLASEIGSNSNEIGASAEARTLACSMIPQRKNENPFFAEAAQRVLAELLKYRPSTNELAKWLASPNEIDRRLAGTEAALMIDPHAGPQRVGVLATLAMFGEALRSLPALEDADEAWSSATWAKNGTGSIFLTFPPMMREQIRPLIATWLELLTLRLQRSGIASGKKTWILVDEMPTLGALPALTAALTENRKSGNPIVVALQDKSQMDAIFSELSSTMLSMPATKIICRTSEPSSAKWASQAIGSVEYEQLRESESTNPKQGQSRSEHTEFVTRPLVMPEELDGLPPLHGYIKQGNLVADLETCYLDLPCVQPGFVPRAPTPNPPPLVAGSGLGGQVPLPGHPGIEDLGLIFV